MIAGGLFCLYQVLPDSMKEWLWLHIKNSDIYLYYKRHLFANRCIRTLKEPVVYPYYVENRKFMASLEHNIRRDAAGVLIIWGPSGSGKSSYAIRKCNELAMKNITLGTVVISNSTFCEEGYDGGTTWLNKSLGTPQLIEDGRLFSSVISHSSKEKVVILLDQFDNVWEHSDHAALGKLIKRMAEDAVKYNTYVVILCVTDPSLACCLYRLNGGEKIRFVGNDPQELRWKETDEVTRYIAQLNDSQKLKFSQPRMEFASTPGLCVDCLFMDDDAAVERRAKAVAEAWASGAAMIQNKNSV